MKFLIASQKSNLNCLHFAFYTLQVQSNGIYTEKFLKASAAGFGAAVLSLGLTGCRFDDDDDTPVSFDHGVASGDPLSDSLIIWTRVTPLDVTTKSLKVQWQSRHRPKLYKYCSRW
ncbi:PhoD-like phosphatase N-terminal domain-containing protein [Pseudoalteromonas sp. Hal099]